MTQQKTALVLEGGALRGLYSAGVLDVFMQNDIKVDTIIGVSAGALFGINYKSKQIGRAFRYNIKYAHDRRYMGLYSLITTGDIMNRKFCFNDLVYNLDPLDFETYNNSPIEFYAVITNVETGKPEYIEIKNAQKDMEYLRASGSMPFVSNFVEINGNKYLDGAISDAIPFQKILDMDYERIIVVLTRPANYVKGKEKLPFKLFYSKYPNFVKTALNAPEKYNSSLNLIKKYEEENKIVVLRPSKNLKIHRVEKNLKKLHAIYELGLSDATDNIEKIKNYLAKTKNETQI